MTTNKIKPSAALHWLRALPATDRETIDMLNARQITLRTRLRNHYWLTECTPLTSVTVTLLRRKMVSIDKRDKMTETEVEEVLSEACGFLSVQGGSEKRWTIPDYDEQRTNALSAGEVTRQRMSDLGKASGKARASAKVPEGATALQPVREPALALDSAADF